MEYLLAYCYKNQNISSTVCESDDTMLTLLTSYT